MTMSMPMQIDGGICPRCSRFMRSCRCEPDARARSEQLVRAATNDYNAGRITWREYTRRIREAR